MIAKLLGTGFGVLTRYVCLLLADRLLEPARQYRE